MGTNGKLVLGIDLGGTDCKFALVNESGQVVKRAKHPTGAEQGPEKVIEGIARNATELIRGENVAAVGMGVPGPMSSVEGIVYEAPNLPGWNDTPVRDMLQSHLDRLPVLLNNDANAAAYGEFWAGAGRDPAVQNMILFTLGTGVGGGIILNGELYVGPDDTAGELGHMCINYEGPQCNCGGYGCLETYAGATGVRRMVREALASGVEFKIEFPEGGADEDFGAKVVFDAAVSGCASSANVLRTVGFCLGVAASTCINVFNPDMIVYSGAMINAGDYIFGPLREVAEKWPFKKPAGRVKIGVAELGSDAGVIGAAGLALRAITTRQIGPA